MARLSKIAIVGGGIAGLTAALALVREGIDVEVYEQAPELKEVGAGVQISSNGTRVLYALGLQEAVERMSSVPAAKEIRLWNTGQTWKLFDLGAVSVELSTDILRVHAPPGFARDPGRGIRRLKPDAVRLGMRCRCRPVNAEAILRFDNGEVVQSNWRSAPTACIRSCAKACSAPPRRNSPAVSPGAAWCRWTGCPGSVARCGTNWVGAGGHVVHYPLRRAN